MITPPAARQVRSTSTSTPSATSVGVCSLTVKYEAISSAISPETICEMPIYGSFSPSSRMTHRLPCPITPATSSFPSSLSGRSASGWEIYPLTFPQSSETASATPAGPSPRNCSVRLSPLFFNILPISDAAVSTRPSAAVQVGEG